MVKVTGQHMSSRKAWLAVPCGGVNSGSRHGSLCPRYLVVVEMSVDGEAVRAQALQVSGAVSLCPPLDVHEGGVAPGPQQLRRILLYLLLLLASAGEVLACNHQPKSHLVCKKLIRSYVYRFDMFFMVVVVLCVCIYILYAYGFCF